MQHKKATYWAGMFRELAGDAIVDAAFEADGVKTVSRWRDPQ